MENAMKKEVWKQAVGFEEMYEVSDMGNVRSWKNNKWGRAKSPRMMSPCKNKVTGRLSVSLCDSKTVTRRYVHRLVLEAFVGPCPEGYECCHNNGVCDDNRLENLRWGTSSDNKYDMVKHGQSARGRSNKLSSSDVKTIDSLLYSGVGTLEIATLFNVVPSVVSSIKYGKTWGWLTNRVDKGGSNQLRGQDDPKSKLKETQVLEIIDQLKTGERIVDLAKVYSVSKTTIAHIKHGRTWKHLTKRLHVQN